MTFLRNTEIKNGVLCLTFDDRNYDRWAEEIPLFEKYGAHASFFPCGIYDAHVLSQLKKLSGFGHSVGSHTVNHADAPEYFQENGQTAYWENEIMPHITALKSAGIQMSSFAYPNGKRNRETDEFLLRNGICHLRGCNDGIPEHRIVFYDPDGSRVKDYRPVASNDAAFLPVSEIRKRKVIYGPIIGESYHTDISDILNAVQRASQTNSLLMMTSHDICADARGINMKTEWLEMILRKAAQLNVYMANFDELNDISDSPADKK